MVDLKPGQTFVPGTTAKVARQLLANAEYVGLPRSVVRTTEGGFVVPDVVAPGNQTPAQPPQAAPDPSPAPRRRRSKKNPQKGS